LDIPPVLLGVIFLVIIASALIIPRLISKIRQPVKKRNILIVIISILLVIALFFIATRPAGVQKELTDEEKEIDRFLDEYYDGLRSKSVSNIVKLFTDNAVVVSSDGTTYRGIEMIKRYYDDKLRNLERYEVKQEVIKINIEDGSADASYYTTSTSFIRGATREQMR
jgi:ketosteroid isomerase-like protein